MGKNIVKTNTKCPKKNRKQIMENIGAKIFKRLGAILSRKTKEQKTLEALLREVVKIRKKINGKKQ